MPSTFKTVCLFGKYKDTSVSDAVNGLAEYLRYRDMTVLVGDTTADEIISESTAQLLDDKNGQRVDLGIVIGGDGTMLHVARWWA
jgi:NAD+ kinase